VLLCIFLFFLFPALSPGSAQGRKRRLGDAAAAAADAGIPDTPEGRRAARKLLAETFGSKKKRANIRSAEMNAVTSDNVRGQSALLEHLEASTAGMVANASEISGADGEAAAARLVPPHDATATDVAEAYPIDGLITTPEWEAIDTNELVSAARSPQLLAELAEAASDVRHPLFVIASIRRIANLGHKSSELRRIARLLSYIGFMCFFRNCPEKDLNVSGVTAFTGCPEVVAERLLRDFADAKPVAGGSAVQGPAEVEAAAKAAAEAAAAATAAPEPSRDDADADADAEAIAKWEAEKEANAQAASAAVFARAERASMPRYRRSTALRTKCVLHILALALHVDGFCVETTELARDLGMTAQKTAGFLRELGCKVASRREGGESIYRGALVAPLVFPAIRRPQRAGGKK
jgi:hypothetical protein